MPKHTPGHHAGRFVDWLHKRLLSLLWLALALFMAVTVHQFVERFVDFTTYVVLSMEGHKGIPSPEMGQPPTEN